MLEHPSAASPATSRVVEADDLDESVVILAYLLFSDRYRPMDEKTCRWLRHNFKDSYASVLRGSHRMNCLAQHIVSGDFLLKVYGFTEAHQKLTHPNPRFAQELKKSGFLKFRVKGRDVPSVVFSSQKSHQQSVSNANQFLEKINESVVLRDVAIEAVKDMMDNVRIGKGSLNEIQSHIQKMVAGSSSEAIQAIASLKQSDQTYAHCVDAAAIFQSTYDQIIQRKKMAGIFSNTEMTLLGGFMHDIGKSKVPTDILESTVRFDRESREM